MRERLDTILQRRFNLTRTQVQSLIREGKVFDKNGVCLDKPGMKVPPNIELKVIQDMKYVSRGGFKLEHAVKYFNIDVRDKIAIDIGASTGGFTDCLLKHGVSKVYAVDVGYGQLAWQLRVNPRVVVMERCNIRHLDPEVLSEKPNFFTVDCSFISLKLILPKVISLVCKPAEGIILIKPQFEVGKEHVGKGGVVRNTEIINRTVQEILDLAENLGFKVHGVVPSPIRGPAGNQEYLAYLTLN
ncbi:MAG: TlyA family RNA methyltransferase [Candidatus Hydrogenedentes bacterium]|nr:TlyA family RNA methyltransferase [Candidatus Hydrogenedentota bacterium]